MSKSFPKLLFWGMHVWVIAYVGVLLGAFTIQFAEGEFPCPLCMLQRYGMILSTIGALWIIMQAKRGELTPASYQQGLGMGVLGAAAGALVSVRQILLHIKPGDPGYGSAVMGYHLYTWALITFYIVILFVAVVSMFAPVGIPEAPEGKGSLTISSVVVWLFVILVGLNVIAIFFLEGFALVLPDDPDSYNLIKQLTGG